jgi:hypothetical protein
MIIPSLSIPRKFGDCAVGRVDFARRVGVMTPIGACEKEGEVCDE